MLTKLSEGCIVNLDLVAYILSEKGNTIGIYTVDKRTISITCNNGQEAEKVFNSIEQKIKAHKDSKAIA